MKQNSRLPEKRGDNLQRQSISQNQASNTHQNNVNISKRQPCRTYNRKKTQILETKKKIIFLACVTVLIFLAMAMLTVSLISCISDYNTLRKKTQDSDITTTSPGTTDTVETRTDNETTSAPESDTQEPPQDELSYNEMHFLSDISEFESYMNPENYNDYLVLVNTVHTLDESSTPTDLIDVVDTRPDRSYRKLREYAEKALEAFLTEARAYGFNDVTVTSAYRSYNEQTSIFNGYISNYMAKHPSATHDEAYAYVSTFSAPPGTSEHQTGLCVDMHNLPSADVSFCETQAAQWMAENCWKFGYILRFPENKTNITGISFEPWHFRYVGRYHAAKIHELGYCLEEYYDYLIENQS